MSIAVIYESMFGNTRAIALAIAEGLAPFGTVVAANVNDPRALEAARLADLLVLGGPTHAHGMTRPASGPIGHALTKRGSRAVISPESFLVSKDNTLDDGELARARDWGASVGKSMEQFIHH